MKKIILVLIIFIACYFIYNLTIDKKVSYLTLGDILSKGTNEYGVSNNGYSNYIRDYLKDKGMLKVNASGGVEFKERYGIYVTGEYAAGNDDREDYKIGVTLKASF